MGKTINISDYDYEYIKKHVDGDRVTSIRSAVSVVVDKAKDCDRLVLTMVNDTHEQENENVS